MARNIQNLKPRGESRWAMLAISRDTGSSMSIPGEKTSLQHHRSLGHSVLASGALERAVNSPINQSMDLLINALTVDITSTIERLKNAEP